ncbi:MAG: hypothetical protein KC613_10110 [Myxococcales bacterium]|nr:hypothetical protein [Myxococcales bacterium]MCB9523468.1 hypothetical protein [Myxococcales bacterium]
MPERPPKDDFERAGARPKDLTDAALLSALAAGLCQDAGVSLEVYPGPWAWDPVRRVIRVNEKDLETHGPDYCAGILANEIGHFYLTRYSLFHTEFPSELGRDLLFEALEDPRVDDWMMTRYPGIERWHDEAHGQVGMIDPGLPYFLVFCQGAADEQRAMYGVATPVAHALNDTWLARRQYAETLPPTALVQTATKSLRARYKLQVWPALVTPRWVPPAHEQAIQVSAVEALRLAEREILPVAAELYEQDVEAIEKYLNDRPERAARARRLIESGEAREVLVQSRHHPGRRPLTSRWAHDLAKDVLEAILREGRPRRLIRAISAWRPGGDPSVLPPPPPPELPPLHVEWHAPSDYDRAYAKVATQVERLTQHLEELLRPKKRLKERSGYPSGRHIDLKKLMAFEADPRRYDELWVRSTIPDRRDVAMTLLVDLSGSMSGEKVQAALLGTILLAETLAALDVAFAVTGFQDVLIELKGFDQHFDDAARQAIAEIPQEVSGCRHGGNNQPGYNDDGPCLMECAVDLLAQPATERVLIVVSDGLPEGVRSTREDLRRTIGKLTQPGINLELIGLGLGPGTGHVTQYYPESVANVAVARFADEIARLIERVLVGA